MESIVRKINYYDSKYEQIKFKITNYILSPQSYFDFIKLLKQFNVISLDLDEIYFGYSNSKRYFLSLVNCLCLWIALLLMIFTYNSYNQINKVYHLDNYINVIKQLIVLAIDCLILALMLKIDLIIEERKHNLRCFKLFHYLAYDLKDKHKLNDKQYKLLTISIKIMNLSFKLGIPSAILGNFLFFLLSGILMESVWIWIFGVLYIYTFFVTISLYTVFVDLTFIYSFYYKSLFDQINKSIKLLDQQQNYSVLNVKLLRLINEHNSVSNEIAKLNSFVRKSLAIFFITSSSIEHLFIYLAFKSDHIWQIFIWTNVSFCYFFINFGMCYLFSLIPSSAHQSYDKLYSILIKRKINIRVKFKVRIFSLIQSNFI